MTNLACCGWHQAGGDGTMSCRTLANGRHLLVSKPLCPARLAYRDMSDIGSRRTCGNPAVTHAGFCRRHDPVTAPKRGKDGRILARCPMQCATCRRDYDAYCKASNHETVEEKFRRTRIALEGACPNHPSRPSASPSSNLCGPCLMGKP